MAKLLNPSALYDALMKVTTPSEREHWCGDLSVKGTQAVESILQNYVYSHQVFPYRRKSDGELWYTIPFADRPYWEGGGKNETV